MCRLYRGEYWLVTEGVPLFAFAVVATGNAVNISDGMTGRQAGCSHTVAFGDCFTATTCYIGGILLTAVECS